MAGTPVSGTDGRVTVNGVNLNTESWEINEHADDIETTSFESVGTDNITYEEGITGKVGADISLEMFWDASLVPTSSPPNLKRGQIIGPIVCFTSKTLNEFYNFPSVRVLRCRPKASAKGGYVGYSVQAKSNGQYTTPG